MPKITLTDLESISANESTAISNVNANNALIEAAIENTLSRDGTSPNTMEANIDMNSNRIVNLPLPLADTEPVRLIDLSGSFTAVPAIGDIVDEIDADRVAVEAALAAALAAQAAAEAAAALAEDALAQLQNDISYTTESFSGTGAQTVFTTTASGTEDNSFVFVNGVYQNKDTYSYSGTTLTFTEAPPSGTNNIQIMIGPTTTIATTSIAGVSGLQAALDAKAALAGATFTGGVTGTTLSLSSTLGVTGASTLAAATLSGVLTVPAGAVGTPSLTTTGDTNTGFWFSTADTINASVAGSEVLEIDATSIDVTVPLYGPTSFTVGNGASAASKSNINFNAGTTTFNNNNVVSATLTSGNVWIFGDSISAYTAGAIRAHFDGAIVITDGDTLPNTTDTDAAEAGVFIHPDGYINLVADSAVPLRINRMGTSGLLAQFYQPGVSVGSISVNSSGRVSYNTFLGAHYSELADGSKPDILIGTVVESLDEVIDTVDEMLPKFKVSNTPNSRAVYGVFADWEEETGYASIASVGVFSVRVNRGAEVERGDLLVSNGDGTAWPQDDDIVRSSTLGKVVSAKPIMHHEDGSYLVSVALMCG